MRVLATFSVSGVEVELRDAVAEDVPRLVGLLADDRLGRQRDGLHEPEDLEAYLRAFQTIDQDPNHLLIAAYAPTDLVGTMQLSFLPGLARRGSWRAQIEAVRVAAAFRGAGLGTAMMRWAIEAARQRDCRLVQLTTDKRRTDAHRLYQRLGFQPSHEGMKLQL